MTKQIAIIIARSIWKDWTMLEMLPDGGAKISTPTNNHEVDTNGKIVCHMECAEREIEIVKTNVKDILHK